MPCTSASGPSIDQHIAEAIGQRTVLIVENLETGLALPDMPGVVAVMKLGAAGKLVAALPWLAEARCLYVIVCQDPYEDLTGLELCLHAARMYAE